MSITSNIANVASALSSGLRVNNLNADFLDGQSGDYYTGYTDTANTYLNLIKFDKSGGTVSGNVSVSGNTTIGGSNTNTLTINSTAVSIPNNLNIDSGTLFIDAANNNVGIGTSFPVQALHVVSTANQIQYPLRLQNDGTSGITLGTGQQFYVYNGTSVSRNTTLIATGSTWSYGTYSANQFSISSAGSGGIRFATTSSAPITFHTGNADSDFSSERLRIDSSGKVGIGTSSPQALLSIGSGSAVASNPTYEGSVLIASQMNSLSSAGGIEFRSVNFASGYGHRISSPDLSGGNTPLVFERRTNSVSWSESLRVTSSGDVLITGGGGQLISERFQVKGTTLGGNSGDKAYNTSFYTPDTSNATRINILDYRYTSGTSHTSSRNLIQRRVDSTDMGYIGFDSSATSIGWGTTEHFRIDSSGNVGIGTSSPSYKLDVAGVNARLINSGSTALTYFDVNNAYGTTRIGTDASGNGYVGTASNLPLNIVAGNIVRATFDTSGNLGLGVTPSAAYLTAPGALQMGQISVLSQDINSFYVNANLSAPAGKFLKTGNFGLSFHIDSAAGSFKWFNTAAVGTAGVFASTNQTMTLSAAGSLLINCTSNPLVSFGDAMLSINSSGIDGINLKASSGSNAFNIQKPYSYTNGTMVSFSSLGSGGASTQVGTISISGSTTTYATSSDYRLKENIQPIQNALKTVALMNPVTFTWKSDGKKGQGFIAHEIQSLFPESVVGIKDDLDDDGTPIYQAVDASLLIATLTKAIQELSAKNDILETEINKIKQRIN